FECGPDTQPSRYLAEAGEPGQATLYQHGLTAASPDCPVPEKRTGPSMAEKTINLRGLKCPLPALKTKKALSGMQTEDVLIVECTDPLAAIDIPNLLRQTGDTLEHQA